MMNQNPDMTNRVYYFSGTGNSYDVAQTIAKCIGAQCMSIVCLKTGDTIKANILCFVFPVYDFKPPQKVTKIIEQLSDIRAQKTIVFATYGIALSSALFHMKSTLRRKNVTLFGGYGIKMPHNAMGSAAFSKKEDDTRIDKAQKKVCDIVEDIQKGTELVIEKTSFFESGTIFTQWKYIITLLGILIFKGSKSLEFTVTQNCNGCSQCKKICSSRNIHMLHGKPGFAQDCSSCFACLQSCPASAIRLGTYGKKDLGIKPYWHPNVSPVELYVDQCE